MKKNMKWIAMLLAFLLLFTACGASSKEAVVTTETSAAADSWYDVKEEAVEEETAAEEVTMNTSSASGGTAMTVEEVQDYSEKIIYSGYVYMETTDFDGALTALDQAVQAYGGFVQDSNVSGYASYNSDGSTVVKDRWAYYVVRVPSDKFNEFMTLADGIGNVTNSSRTAENVTSQYTDYEARLESLYTQEERLLAMLEESGDLESLIKLEERLSEVRYEIESIERNLRNLDQKLSYSTVTLELQEVEIYTPTVAVQRTFGEKLSDAFTDGWNGFVRGLQNFVIGLAEALPTLVLLAVIAAVVILVVLKIRKKAAKKVTQAEVKNDEKPNA